jgi:hypothetical protein
LIGDPQLEQGEARIMLRTGSGNKS